MSNLLPTMVAAAALGAAPACAQSWYFGLGGGEARLGASATEFADVGNAHLDDKDRAIALRAGVRLHANFAVELGYYDFGEYRYDAVVSGLPLKGSAKARSLGLSAVAIAPLERLDIYARVGYARSEIKSRAGVEGFTGVGSLVDPRRRRDNEFFGGVGARFDVGRQFGVFAEYQKHDKLDIDAWLVGVDYRF